MAGIGEDCGRLAPTLREKVGGEEGGLLCGDFMTSAPSGQSVR
jgi:hypothetical protein